LRIVRRKRCGKLQLAMKLFLPVHCVSCVLGTALSAAVNPDVPLILTDQWSPRYLREGDGKAK
jgi:hypothetical protein